MFRSKMKKRTDERQGDDETGRHLSFTVPGGDGASFAMNFPAGTIDALRHMVTRLEAEDSLPDRLALVASLRGEGVTTLTRALATVMANDLAVRICLVELNWWWPAPAGWAPSGGLAAVLGGEATLNEVIVATDRSNLDVLPAGEVERADRPILARSSALKTLINDLGERYDHLLLDVPALLATSDAIPLLGLADACCPVVQQGATSIEDARMALKDIQHLPVLGVVMNQVQMKTPAWLLKYIPQE